MDDKIFMYTALCLFLISYVPLIRVEYKQRHRYELCIRNLPERLIISTAMVFGMTYYIRTNNTTLIICAIPQLSLETCILLSKFWYCVIVRNKIQTQEIQTQENDIIAV